MKALGQIAVHEADLPGRKLIFWVSPGWPLLSGPGIQLTGKQQDQAFASIVGLSTDLRKARAILWRQSPGNQRGTGGELLLREFLKGVSDAQGRVGQSQPAGVSCSKRRPRAQFQQRRRLASETMPGGRLSPTTKCLSRRLRPIAATNITAWK